MRREIIGYPTAGWQDKMRDSGFAYNTSLDDDGNQFYYWLDGPYYEFRMDEILRLEETVKTLQAMCIAAGDHMIANPDIMRRMRIPEAAWPAIIKTWDDNSWNSMSVYGRFDLWYDGNGPAKMLEYNADTPTSLLETYFQWKWFENTQDKNRVTDQWNSVEEKLVAMWNLNLAKFELRTGRRVRRIHFAYTSAEESGEDWGNTAYMAYTAELASKLSKSRLTQFDVVIMPTEEIGLGEDGRFYDQQGHEIEICFKLYPWEWLTDGRDAFGPAVIENMAWDDGTVWVEPACKMLWSNKGLLPVLWELYRDKPESQFLLPAYFDDDDEARSLTEFIRKPLLGREGANMEIVSSGSVLERTGGDYDIGGAVLQQFMPLPGFETMNGIRHPVLGVWVIGGVPAGLGIRESPGLITGNTSNFVCHAIVD